MGEDQSRETTTSTSTADTRRSSTFGATLAFRNKRNTTGFSPLRENGAFDENQENSRNTCPTQFKTNKPMGHSVSTPMCKIPNSTLDFTPEESKTPVQSEINYASQS